MKDKKIIDYGFYGKLVIVVSSGWITTSHIAEIAKEIREHPRWVPGKSCMLIVGDNEKFEADLQAIEQIVRETKLGNPRLVAFVSYGEYSYANMSVFTDLYKVKQINAEVFHNLEDAIQWLETEVDNAC